LRNRKKNPKYFPFSFRCFDVYWSQTNKPTHKIEALKPRIDEFESDKYRAGNFCFESTTKSRIRFRLRFIISEVEPVFLNI